MSVGSRIKELRNSLDLTQQKFADRLGIQRGIIGKYEVDVSAPSDAVISLICRITSLLRFEPDSPEWQILENIYNSIAAEKESRE